ncbi:MAG: DNA repair protein RecN [Oscillospiraceae bacterium]|nr:DNA repair protein RecN [Oscillospiraceae bacterium]
MLTLLEIENIAVIAKAEVETERGFNTLTGETGAGKSLLIDSLGLVLGGRAQRELIRAGEDYASVRALFYRPELSPFLEDLGLSPEEDGTVLLQRRIYRDGRNVCRFGAETISLSTLKAIGSRLVAIHGQHDGTALLSSSAHIDFIDGYCRDSEALEDYRRKFRAYKEAERALEEARANAGQRQARIDFLDFQVREISEAGLRDGEEEELTARRKLLDSAEELLAASEKAENASGAAIDALDDTASAVEDIAAVDTDMEENASRLREIFYELKEIHRELASYASRVEFNPEELAEAEERLGVIYRLERKYGLTVADVLETLDKATKELDELTYAEEHGEEMEKDVAEKRAAAEAAANKLSDIRKKGGEELCGRICAELQFLDMPKTRVTFRLMPCELWEKGAERVELLISTNPMEEPKPLAKIASGGELSRIMLAMKSVFSASDDVPVLIFDEIDTGVSGRAAEKIALKISELARERQVLCITHLPVIAAAADRHLLIEKDPETLLTRVRPIEGEERVREIARIMRGDHLTDAALENARELLRKEN